MKFQIIYYNTPDGANPHAFVRVSNLVPLRDYVQSKFVEMKAAHPDIRRLFETYGEFANKEDAIRAVEQLGFKILNVQYA